MTKHLFTALGTVSALVLTVAPAFAMRVVTVPEPSSLSILAIGGATVVGLYAAKKWFKPK